MLFFACAPSKNMLLYRCSKEHPDDLPIWYPDDLFLWYFIFIL